MKCKQCNKVTGITVSSSLIKPKKDDQNNYLMSMDAGQLLWLESLDEFDEYSEKE